MIRFLVGAATLVLASVGAAATPDADARIDTRADLERYIAYFNESNVDRQVAYYSTDIDFKVGNVTLSGREAIARFYRDFHASVREHVRIVDYARTGDAIAVTLPVQFEAFRAYDRNGLKFNAGDKTYHVSFVFYKLRDGKITQIRLARYNGPATDYGPPEPFK